MFLFFRISRRPTACTLSDTRFPHTTLFLSQVEHAPRRAPPVDRRHAEIGVAGEIPRQLRGGRGFEPEVHLDAHGLLEGADHRDRLQPPERRAALDEARQPVKERSEEHTSELHSLMRISYAVFCLTTKTQPPTTI